MKLLIITCSDERVVDYTKYTHPIMKRFADRWDADFKNVDDIFYDDKDAKSWSLRVKLLYDQLGIYDRVLHLDSDVVINKDCPNIFDIVPCDTIGLVFEDKGSRLTNRRARITAIKELYGGNNHWTSGYFNAGMLVASRLHREIFTSIDGKYWGEDCKAKGPDQTHLGYQIMKQGHKYVDLGYKFNHMSMFSEKWNGSPSRFDSYIIHYAGGAKFPDKGKRRRTQMMKDDINIIYKRFSRPALEQLEGRNNLVGAEVGVGKANHASRFLPRLNIKLLYLIDPYKPYRDFQDIIKLSYLQEAEKTAHIKLNEYRDIIRWIKKGPTATANSIGNNSLDFVYIDAIHTYRAVKRDISLYYPKLKKGGLLSGHDYDYGCVKRAVDEFINEKNLKLYIEDNAPRRRKFDWWAWKGK